MAGSTTDGVGTYPASQEQLQAYETAQQALAKIPVPVLWQDNDQHARLFVANFDGSGLNANRAGQALSNVGIIKGQLEALQQLPGSRIASGYQPGPGTEHNPISRIADGVLGFTYDEHIHAMYRSLATQATDWLAQDPQAHISIASVGFSRGAAEIPGFSRLVDRYGILDPTDLHFSRDRDGEMRVSSSRPPLVAAGQVAQAVALFDPVATGIPMDYDRRLPPSVISGFSLLAQDERRRWFPHAALIDQQMTADGRFLGVTVPGAHSDVGGSYHRNGLEIRAGNLMVDYLNALSDKPFLDKRALPADPAVNVVHRSEQGLLGLYEIGSTHAGQPRPVREQLCVVVDPCRDAEPRDDALAARFATQQPTPAPLPLAMQSQPLLDDPRHPQHWRYQQAFALVAGLDAQHGRQPDARSQRLAAAIAAAADAQGLTLDQVVLSRDQQALLAVDSSRVGGPGYVRVEIEPALRQTIAQSTAQLDQVEHQRSISAVVTQAQALATPTQAAPRRALAH